MEEEGGVEPQPISRYPVFKAGRSPSPLHHLPLVEIIGFEPMLTQSKCVVLPLHYISIDTTQIFRERY